MKKSILTIFTIVILMVLAGSACSLVSILDPSKNTNTPASMAISSMETLEANSEPAIECVDPTLKLVSWWRGEGDAADSMGQHDGMFVNNTVFAPGKVGSAFSFNGIDNLVAVPDSDEWTLGVNDFTIDLWVNFNQIQSRTAFIGHDEGGGSTNKWIFWYDEFGDDGSPGPALRFHINPSIGLRNPIFAAWSPEVGQWYHIAITRNASTYAMYIDGAQVGASVHTDEIANAAAPLTIGVSEGFFFNGLIDEVHIFSRGLSSNEIQMIFNAGSGGICALKTLTESSPDVTATAVTNTPLPPAVFACPLAPEPRVNVGDMVRITFATGAKTRLRSAPELGDNLVEMLSEGTELEIMGGPVCYPRPGRNDAYLYWKVFVSSNSKEGWVAEGDFDSYYIEPVTTLSSDKIYFSVNGNLYRMNLDGSDREIVSNIGLGERFSIDSSHNKLYISRWAEQSQILIFDLQSEDETFVDGPGSGGQGLVIDPATSTILLGLYYNGLYVTDLDNAGGWTQLVDRASISPMLGQRGQLQIDSANRHVYFRSAFNGDCGICRYIWRVDFDGNNLTKIIPANGGDALALDLTEGKMYFSDVPGHGTIMRANLDGSGAEVVFTIPGPYHYCWTIVLDVPHKKMYMMLFDETKDFKEKAIARSNLDGTEFEILYEKTENSPEEASGDMDLYLP